MDLSVTLLRPSPDSTSTPGSSREGYASGLGLPNGLDHVGRLLAGGTGQCTLLDIKERQQFTLADVATDALGRRGTSLQRPGHDPLDEKRENGSREERRDQPSKLRWHGDRHREEESRSERRKAQQQGEPYPISNPSPLRDQARIVSIVNEVRPASVADQRQPPLEASFPLCLCPGESKGFQVRRLNWVRQDLFRARVRDHREPAVRPACAVTAGQASAVVDNRQVRSLGLNSHPASAAV